MLALLLAALTALQARPYSPCAHAPGEPGPPIPDAAGRAAVRAEIAAAVDKLDGSPAFARYLTVVAARESSFRPGVIHQLDEDRDGSAAAYRRMRPVYLRTGNPYADHPEAWLTYGLFGQNSNNHAWRVHPRANPRSLCKITVAVAAYALAVQDILPRMRRRCGIESPTWGDVHRAVQGGKLCPRPGRRSRLPAELAVAPVRLADVGGWSR